MVPQGRCERVGKISPPPPPEGFSPRAVQPVAGRYTKYTVAAHKFLPYFLYLLPDMDTVRYARYAPNSADELPVSWQSVDQNSYFTYGRTYFFPPKINAANIKKHHSQ
jgi:hypothetical protein